MTFIAMCILKKSNPQQKYVRKVKMNLFGARIYIIYIPCSNFERKHRKCIFSMAPTLEEFLLLQYMYHVSILVNSYVWPFNAFLALSK